MKVNELEVDLDEVIASQIDYFELESGMKVKSISIEIHRLEGAPVLDVQVEAE